MRFTSCAHCITPFPNPRHSRYCSAACRKAAVALQRRIADEDRLRMLVAAANDEVLPASRIDIHDVDPCAYCGLPAETIDHVIPQSRLGDLEALGIKTLHSTRVWTVPSCRECNSALQARLFRTFAERKAWVKAHLRRKYQKLLKAPTWSPTEIASLGHTLQQAIQDRVHARQTLLLRIRW